MSSQVLIELQNVSREYNSPDRGCILGVSNLNLSIERGKIISIIGPSGCGKTTILKMIAGLLEVTEGKVLYEGLDIEKSSGHSPIGYIPQSLGIFPFRTVKQNIELPLEIQKKENQERVTKLLKVCGLERFSEYYPFQLSGGMRQKVAIARALSTNPKLLLMDEPFSSLDELSREALNEEILDIQASFGTTIIYVTHNIEEAVFLSNKVIVLSGAPGSVVGILDIDLPIKREVALRTNELFFSYVVKVRDILRKI